MEAMYKAFSSVNEITIWCEGQAEPPDENGRRRKAEESEGIPCSKRSDAIDKLAQELHENTEMPIVGPNIVSGQG